MCYHSLIFFPATISTITEWKTATFFCRLKFSYDTHTRHTQSLHATSVWPPLQCSQSTRRPLSSAPSPWYSSLVQGCNKSEDMSCLFMNACNNLFFTHFPRVSHPTPQPPPYSLIFFFFWLLFHTNYFFTGWYNIVLLQQITDQMVIDGKIQQEIYFDFFKLRQYTIQTILFICCSLCDHS